jgi:hypothetical protein
MNANRARIIAAMIESLSSGIRVARAHALDQTAALLEMAKLDLQTELHGITDEEMHTFCRTVEAANEAATAAPPAAQRRADGDRWHRSREAANGIPFTARAASRRAKKRQTEAREPLRPRGGPRQGVVGSARKGDTAAPVAGARHEAPETSLPEIGKLLH